MADEDENELNDRQVVEEYLKLYCIEEVLDETLNDIVERRPTNPYVEIAKLIEAKTMPEIIEIILRPMLSASGVCGVEAMVNTNLGKFSGQCAFPFDIDDDSDALELKDFDVFELKIDDALKNIDPTDLPKVEETLLGLADIDPAVVMAVSIAAARAGSRHRGIPLYKFLSELAGTEPQLPVPVPSVVARTVGAHFKKQTQNIQLYPVNSASLYNAINTLMKATNAINQSIVSNKAEMTIDPGCCSQLANSTTENMCLIVRDAIASAGYAVKISYDYRGGTLVSIKDSEDGADISYAFNGNPEDFEEESTPSLQSGAEVVENIIVLLKEMEFVSIEDPLHVKDMDSLRNLKDRIAETFTVIKEQKSDDLKYNTTGIGGDETCHLQVVADGACKNAEEIKILADENVFNAVKIRFDKVATITGAIAMVKAAREIGWGVIVSCNEEAPETLDTFISDFAVGMGAGQLMGGSLQSAENYEKYNRLLEISRIDNSLQFAGPGFRR